jgi:hypothetical protein
MNDGECTVDCFQLFNDGENGTKIPQRIVLVPADFGNCNQRFSPNILPIIIEPVLPFTNTFNFLLKRVKIAEIIIGRNYFNEPIITNIIKAKIPNSNIDVNIDIEFGIRLNGSRFWDMILKAGIPDLNSEPNSQPRDYVVGDVYAIDTSCFITENSNIYVRFRREPRGEIRTGGNEIFRNMDINNMNNSSNINSKCTKNKKCDKNKCLGNDDELGYCPNNNLCPLLSDCENVRVPAILINAQTNIIGSDLGDANFQICDEIKYYDYDPDTIKGCKIIYINIDNIKQTSFQEGNISIYKVLKGQGKTACEKISNLYIENQEELGIDFTSFYENIFTYALIRYILSKLLYGNFTMNYLLQKYYEQFIEDLRKSRFCAFVENFLDCNLPIYGYDKYFI